MNDSVLIWWYSASHHNMEKIENAPLDFFLKFLLFAAATTAQSCKIKLWKLWFCEIVKLWLWEFTISQHNTIRFFERASQSQHNTIWFSRWSQFVKIVKLWNRCENAIMVSRIYPVLKNFGKFKNWLIEKCTSIVVRLTKYCFLDSYVSHNNSFITNIIQISDFWVIFKI